MQRLIPGKTKVSIELFKGVTIGDVVVGIVALVMILLVILSNLPWKVAICIGIGCIAGILLFRLDEQANYVYLLHILSFFGYTRHFGRIYNDEMLEERFEKGETDAAIDRLFGENAASPLEEAENRKRSKAEAKERKAAQKAGKAKKKSRKDQTEGLDEMSLDAAVPKESEKERKKRRKEEDKLLKSKAVSEEEKEAIRERRKEESRDSARRIAEAKEATIDRAKMEGIIPFTGIKDGYIEYLDKSYYGAVLEIDPVEFRFFSEHRRQNSIENCFGRILRSLHAGYSANIVKLDRPIMYDSYLAREYSKLEKLSDSYENAVLTEDELKARVEIEYDRINELQSYCGERQVVNSFFYLVLFESDKHQLEIQIREAQQLLQQGELKVRRLDDRGLAIFLKYSNQIDFNERDIEKIRPEDYYLWAMPDTVDIRPRRIEVNHIVTHNFRVVSYPTIVGDAWLAGVMSIPGTKVVVKCRPMDRTKSIRNIDHSLTELRGQWSQTGVDSRRMEIETHISSLQELLTTLQSDSEVLLECNVYVTAYDIVATRNDYRIPQPPLSELPTVNEMKKNIRRSWQESGFKLNNMEFDQVQAFIGSQVSALDPMAKEGRGLPSNTVAAGYPWIFAHVSDEGGIKLGESDGIPVFIDFFRRDSERVNSNMVIVGKSGSGKSYATKSLLANMAAEDAKIFILDPENEYTELAANLHGQIINVGNAQYGRLNPFHIITALDDDEAGDSGPSGSYATHLQFLEEFFKQIMPDCENEAMEYLNTLVDHMYLEKDITPETDLSKLRPEDYPIFDDLYDEVLQEFQSTDNPFTRDMLRTLMNYIAKFSTGGRNANIWNGPSTVTTEENFTVFNFQSMLANRNATISNAQMMLVLKYIDNEIIKNRDYNTKYKASRKIVVVIDEAHVFIDAKYPIALDFMFQLAKRIRKYNGMQVVITQNIKDFVGSEELARKSTAIINACQYSFIFALAPNDMQDLVKLYEKAGGINESEQEQIVQAPRGQAFVVMSPTSRSSFRIETAGAIQQMFEDRDYESRYFSGEEGTVNWENFVGGSRQIRAERYEMLPTPLSDDLPYEDEQPITLMKNGHGVSLHVYEEDEYETLNVPAKDQAASFHVGEDRPAVTISEENAPPVQQIPATAGIALDSSFTSEPAMAVFSQIANALGRMADAATGMAPMPAAVPMAPAQMQYDNYQQPAAPYETYQQAPAYEEQQSETPEEDAMLVALQKKLREKDEEIARLQAEKEEEMRRLKDETLQPETVGLEENATPAFETEPAGEPGISYAEPQDIDEEPDVGEDEEETGDLFSLFGGEEEPSADDEEPEEEDDWDAEEPEDDEEFGADDLIDESEEESDEEVDDDDDDEDDDDFMSSFCSFAARLKSMSPFERIKANGQEVAEITLEDLAEEAKAQLERRRSAHD